MKFLTACFFIFMASVSHAQLFCGADKTHCERYGGSGGGGGGHSTNPAYPSTSSSITINPSAVPVEKGFGGELIFYKNSGDFALVKGLGRVGAAISPSNSEETFFGPPGFELANVYLKRQLSADKFTSTKTNLATAFSIFGNKQSGLKRFDLSVGVVGKYNRITKSIWPGAGVNAVIGPLTVGYAGGQDELAIDMSSQGGSAQYTTLYTTETYSAGVSLGSLALDYSKLRLYGIGVSQFEVVLITGSLLLQRWILTYSTRIEQSPRPSFDFSTGTLKYENQKTENFMGAQFAITGSIQLNAFWNYYLLHELSVGTTLFF